jgi:hypothetical protein
VEIDLSTDSGQMMKVVRQNFCMQLEGGGGNASDKSSEELEILSESVEMGRKADDRRERERGGFGAANPCVFIHRIWKGAESGGGGKGEAPHGSSGHPPLFYRVCPCGS